MDKETERLKKAERIFAALDKGDRSRCRYAQLVELQQELDALIPLLAIRVPEDQKKDQSTIDQPYG